MYRFLLLLSLLLLAANVLSPGRQIPRETTPSDPSPQIVRPYRTDWAPKDDWERGVLRAGHKLVVARWESLVVKTLAKFRSNLGRELILSIIAVESMGDPNVCNQNGCGLMGITTIVCAQLRVKNCDLRNPVVNVEIGIRYLEYLKNLGLEGNNLLLAYHKGPDGAKLFLRANYVEDSPYIERIQFMHIHLLPRA